MHYDHAARLRERMHFFIGSKNMSMASPCDYIEFFLQISLRDILMALSMTAKEIFSKNITTWQFNYTQRSLAL